jgi:hypothetical protein
VLKTVSIYIPFAGGLFNIVELTILPLYISVLGPALGQGDFPGVEPKTTEPA